MLSSLQPVKRTHKTDDTEPQNNVNNIASTSTHAIAPRPRAPMRKSGPVATQQGPKRRRLNSDDSPALPAISLQPRQGLISSYFTPSESYQSDDQDIPPDSLYDAMQKTVHEAEAKSEDKRTLRSQDDSAKTRSVLALYFANYDDIMSDAPKAAEAINRDTVFLLKGDLKKKERQTNASASPTQLKTPRRKSELGAAIHLADMSPSARYNGAQVLDFSPLEKSADILELDPLNDEVYFKAHRRAERKEKQLRNIERERAVHEEAQLEKLLDGLQGHDWLRLMGVTGVHDTDVAKYQSKREYFIKQVKDLVAKFQHWREEEKRQKSEKNGGLGKSKRAADDRASRDRSVMSDSASQQLQHEASVPAIAKIKRPAVNHPLLPVVYRAPTPEGPFLSFFDKRHLRDAALGKNRHGRTALAFGLPIPDVEDADFDLPADYIDPHSLKESARRRRRMKRELLVDSTSKQ